MVLNVGYRRQRRLMMSAWGGAAGGLTIAGLVAGDTWAALVGPWFLLTLGVPVAYAPRWVGLIYAQEDLSADESGLHYGPKYTVPWSKIEGAEVRRRLLRSPRLVLVAPDWRPGGILWRLERHRGLPLSDFDPDWRDDVELASVLRKYLPDHTETLGI